MEAGFTSHFSQSFSAAQADACASYGYFTVLEFLLLNYHIKPLYLHSTLVTPPFKAEMCRAEFEGFSPDDSTSDHFRKYLLLWGLKPKYIYCQSPP